MPRIVLATFGSFGDLHPYLAVALALKARGHRAVVATSALYREKVIATGLDFAALRPDLPAPGTDPEFIRRLMDPRRGTERIVRSVFMPAVRPMFDDLLAACAGADVLVSHPLVYPAPVVVAKTPGLRWASSHLAPIGFLSAHDPPVLPPFPVGSERLRVLGPAFHRALFGLAKRASRSWAKPLADLRAEHGLPPAANLMFEGAHAPELVLALFSERFARAQPDWPAQTRVTGFPFYDRLTDADAGLSPGLSRFLDAGSPPVVFTLGTSAVQTAGDFYAESLAAAERLGRRAVLLVGNDPRNRPARPVPENVILAEYAPHSALFPRAAAVVHQGGIGTTSQALRAGVPALVVPFAHDQPDNAARVRRLGVGRALPRKHYRAARAADELRTLLTGETYARPARELGERIRRENGAETAANAIEGLMVSRR